MNAPKNILLGLLAASGVMMGVLVAGAHSPLAMRGGFRFVAEAASALAVCAAAVAWSERIPSRAGIFRAAFFTGMAGAVLQVVHMSLEAFGQHVGDRGDLTTGFMAAALFWWGAVGFAVAWRAGRMRDAVFAAGFSAVATMIVAVAYGLGLAWAGYPDDAYVRTWPEYVQSGWSDARAFAIANSLDAVLSHFVAAPVIGSLLGGVGAWLAFMLRRSRAGTAARDA